MHISKISLIFKHGCLSGLVWENGWPLHNCKTVSQVYEADQLWNTLLKDSLLVLLLWPPESQNKLILSSILFCFVFFMMSFVALITQVCIWENVHKNPTECVSRVTYCIRNKLHFYRYLSYWKTHFLCHWCRYDSVTVFALWTNVFLWYAF
jgi:hypothetical protein